MRSIFELCFSRFFGGLLHHCCGVCFLFSASRSTLFVIMIKGNACLRFIPSSQHCTAKVLSNRFYTSLLLFKSSFSFLFLFVFCISFFFPSHITKCYSEPIYGVRVWWFWFFLFFLVFLPFDIYTQFCMIYDASFFTLMKEFFFHGLGRGFEKVLRAVWYTCTIRYDDIGLITIQRKSRNLL